MTGWYHTSYLFFHSTTMQATYNGLTADKQHMQFTVGTHKVYLPADECYELDHKATEGRLTNSCYWFTSYVKLN